MSKIPTLEFLLLYLKKVYPSLKLMGTKTTTSKKKLVHFVRTKDGSKTRRFVCGEDYPEPLEITTSQRKSIGRGKKIQVDK